MLRRVLPRTQPPGAAQAGRHSVAACPVQAEIEKVQKRREEKELEKERMEEEMVSCTLCAKQGCRQPGQGLQGAKAGAAGGQGRGCRGPGQGLPGARAAHGGGDGELLKDPNRAGRAGRGGRAGGRAGGGTGGLKAQGREGRSGQGRAGNAPPLRLEQQPSCLRPAAAALSLPRLQALLQRQRLAAEAADQEDKEEEFHLNQAQAGTLPGHCGACLPACSHGWCACWEDPPFSWDACSVWRGGVGGCGWQPGHHMAGSEPGLHRGDPSPHVLWSLATTRAGARRAPHRRGARQAHRPAHQEPVHAGRVGPRGGRRGSWWVAAGPLAPLHGRTHQPAQLAGA